MSKTIFTFKKDLSRGRLDSLSIFESYTRKKTWWNLGLSTKTSIGVYDIHSINSHHRDKFPMLLSYLESRLMNLLIYSKRKSFLRYIANKEPHMRGRLDLQSLYISIDMFDDTFIHFLNGYHNFGKIEIGLQFDNELLERIEANFRDGKYPVINANENYNKENSLKVNFFTIRFNK